MKKLLHLGFLLGVVAPASIAQTNPPSLVCPAPVTAECTSPNGALVNLIASVSDADTNALTVVWLVDGTAFQTNDLAAGTTAVSVDVSFSAEFAIGSHEVVVLVIDPRTDPVSCTTTVLVVDTTPPDIHRLIAAPSVLWPPNHKMRPIQIIVEASDECGPVTCRIASVASNEPANGLGDGNTAIDWALGPGSLDLALRAERSGRGHGRIYTITVECTDAAENTSSQTVDVTVPHDRGKKVTKPGKGNPDKPKKPKKAKKSNGPKH